MNVSFRFCQVWREFPVKSSTRGTEEPIVKEQLCELNTFNPRDLIRRKLNDGFEIEGEKFCVFIKYVDLNGDEMYTSGTSGTSGTYSYIDLKSCFDHIGINIKPVFVEFERVRYCANSWKNIYIQIMTFLADRFYSNISTWCGMGDIYKSKYISVFDTSDKEIVDIGNSFSLNINLTDDEIIHKIKKYINVCNVNIENFRIGYLSEDSSQEISNYIIDTKLKSILYSIVEGNKSDFEKYLSFIDEETVEPVEVIACLKSLQKRKRIINDFKPLYSDIESNNININKSEYTVEFILNEISLIEESANKLMKEYQKIFNESVDIEDEDEYQRVQRDVREKRKIIKQKLECCSKLKEYFSEVDRKDQDTEYEDSIEQKDSINTESSDIECSDLQLENDNEINTIELNNNISEVINEPEDNSVNDNNDAKSLYHVKLSDEMSIVDLYNPADYTYSKPSLILFLGNIYKVDSWIYVYKWIIKNLFDIKKYREVLLKYVGKSILNYNSMDFADSKLKNKLRKPGFITENFYIETNLSALDIIKRIKRVLDLCCIDYKNLQIQCRLPDSVPKDSIEINSEYLDTKDHDIVEDDYEIDPIISSNIYTMDNCSEESDSNISENITPANIKIDDDTNNCSFFEDNVTEIIDDSSLYCMISNILNADKNISEHQKVFDEYTVYDQLPSNISSSVEIGRIVDILSAHENCKKIDEHLYVYKNEENQTFQEDITESNVIEYQYEEFPSEYDTESNIKSESLETKDNLSCLVTINNIDYQAMNYDDVLRMVCEYAICKCPFTMALIYLSDLHCNNRKAFIRTAVPDNDYVLLSNGLQVIRINNFDILNSLIENIMDYCSLSKNEINVRLL